VKTIVATVAKKWREEKFLGFKGLVSEDEFGLNRFLGLHDQVLFFLLYQPLSYYVILVLIEL
jgi:hypothetical protein